MERLYSVLSRFGTIAEKKGTAMVYILLTVQGLGFLILIAGGIWAIWRWRHLPKAMEEDSWGEARLIRVHAKVVRKDVGEEERYSMSKGYNTVSTSFSVTFDLGSGWITLWVNSAFFDGLYPGMNGWITHNGKSLIRFEEDGEEALHPEKFD